MTRHTLLTAVAGLTLLLAACTTDSYETGEGTYSRMVADFAELKSNDQKQGVSFVTDDGVSYALESAYTAWWILKEDSTYRTSESQEGFGDEAAAARPYQCGKLLAFQERQIPEHGAADEERTLRQR